MALASNKMYTLIVVLVIYWAATFIALKGLDWVGKVAKIGRFGRYDHSRGFTDRARYYLFVDRRP